MSAQSTGRPRPPTTGTSPLGTGMSLLRMGLSLMVGTGLGQRAYRRMGVVLLGGRGSGRGCDDAWYLHLKVQSFVESLP